MPFTRIMVTLLYFLSTCPNSMEEDYKHSPDDAILLVKFLVNSESLSQPPLTLVPAAFVPKMSKAVASLPRNLLSERAKKELHGFWIFQQFQHTSGCFPNQKPNNLSLWYYCHNNCVLFACKAHQENCSRNRKDHDVIDYQRPSSYLSWTA